MVLISFVLSEVLSCEGVVNGKVSSPLPLGVGALVTGMGALVTGVGALMTSVGVGRGVGVVVTGVRQRSSHCCKFLKLLMSPLGSQLNE